jgi:DNA-binding response OmpR family regulator
MKNRIILVEDDEDTIFIFENLLLKNDFEVKVARNGEEALKIIDEGFYPQVVLADWTMPIMDGLQLCKVIKSEEKYKSLYFIMLTSRSSVQDRIIGLEAGADDFLMKPIDNTELIARIRSGIRIFELQTELAKVEHSKALVEMACTMGHKFNNPLSSLTISLDSLKAELPEEVNEKVKEDWKTIDESIKRINDLVKQLTKLDDPKIINYLDDQGMLDLE